MKNLIGRLPVRDDVEILEYHRKPTDAEIRFGHAATHYGEFTVEECCYPGTRIAKRWFADESGVRWYR